MKWLPRNFLPIGRYWFITLIPLLILPLLIAGCSQAEAAGNLSAENNEGSTVTVPSLAATIALPTTSPSPEITEQPVTDQPTESMAVTEGLPTDPPAADTPQPAPTESPTQSTAEPVKVQNPTAIPAGPTPTFDPNSWQSMPVIPTLSERAKGILEDGLARGNNPQAFAKIGDCESQTDWFLDPFDEGPEHYALGPYQAELQPVIDYYQGSFKRTSLAARQGFTAASLLSPIWADRQQCEKNETPLGCEYRVHKPSVAFIMVGTNDAVNPKTFEKHMRKVIEFTIEQGVLPILGTKADNREGDHSVNATMARLAYEYDIPLWNYWLAVQDLPGNGLQEDGSHLTFGAPYFDQPSALKKAWPVRNLNALQVLKVVMGK